MQKEKAIAKQKIPVSKRMENWMNKNLVPVLKVVAANKYLRALMEGFYVTLPIIVFSSIIGIIMWVPPAIHGDMAWYPLVARRCLMRIYSLTMGLVSLWFTMGISVALAEKLNAQLPVGRKMNIMMVAFAAGSAIFMMSVSGTFAINSDGTGTENFASLLISNLGAQGMLTGIIVGLTLPWVFYLPVRFGWTIKLPKAVPQGVSQSFADVIPYGLSVLVYWGFGYIFIGILDESFTDALFRAIKPIFNGLDSYGFLAAVAFLTAFIWFIGVHGPSVTRPFLTPFMYSNLSDNQALLAQGQHPHWALTYEFSYDFTSTLGGTGCTFVIPILFILFAKSKQLKAVGFASYIPIWFQVNEPALFGAPMILNPIYMLPFFILPIINIVIYKFFIDVLGMNGAIADVPWSMPAVAGLLIGSAFDPLTALLWIVMVTIDFFFYIPFVLIHDKMVCSDELKTAEEKHIVKPLHFSYFTLIYLGLKSKMNANSEKRALAANLLKQINVERKDVRLAVKQERIENKAAMAAEALRIKEEKSLARAARKNPALKAKIENENKSNQTQILDTKKEINVLVICYGAGSSAMMAQSATKGAVARGIQNLKFDSAAYGAHADKFNHADLIILSPQVKMYYDDFKLALKPNQFIVQTSGKQYVDATKNKDLAIDLVIENLPENSIKYGSD
ncbi:PTS transporter subunit EIIC [Spiroplasma endosymbiont of Labia minor]|uniref:PTS transporter subunit EIIC n=1 Tax=Spiroplasma endosymbiont of Labia minor TaxID=3066305 RepID=UPI0030D4FD05